MEVQKVEPERAEKRKRWPSVRLNEIGLTGFAASSASLWLDAPKPPPRKKNSDAQTPAPTTMKKKSNGGGGGSVKAPRIRNLEHVGAKKKSLEDGEVALRWGNGKVRGRQDGLSDSGRLEGGNRDEEAVDEEEEQREEAYEARVSSDSRSGGAEESEERDAGANPGFRGDAMQGAIEDVAVDAEVGFKARKQQQQQRRSEENGDRWRKNACMEIVVADANCLGFRDGTPSSSGQRIVSFSATLTAGVGGWLQELGLGKYAELFEVNEVDTEVLPLLTMDDLREMGVDAVGARRKMFCSIQELGQGGGA